MSFIKKENSFQNETVDDIRNIQQVELVLLKEFQRICSKHGLQYFAIGGTCIGAVRHKGFIPWDDDIDVAMPFRDYKKFQLIARDELSVGLSVYTPQKHRHWCGNFIKLQNDNTAFIETLQATYKADYTGISMDIMPIYGMPKGKVRQCVASLVCSTLIYFNKRQRQRLQEQISKMSKLIWFLNIPVRILKPYNFYLEIVENIFGRFAFNHSDKIIFGWRKRPSRFHKNYTYQNVFDYKDFKEMIELPFEDTTIAVPCGYHNYLTMDFGDYMKLPPKAKRYPRHETVLIDLNKSYKEYVKEGIPK